jgi:hypothetical protein
MKKPLGWLGYSEEQWLVLIVVLVAVFHVAGRENSSDGGEIFFSLYDTKKIYYTFIF